ncbi:uncharacterized protein LOC125526462 [Triticum urartu]|uniref:uncharacterized protein LOC125526462 n=1 Tax=Triticum urartu TaxID=4572 RepID=UPI0020449269|nr:uncharacterized protein LOC125526462 [Triticum urartu]
MKHPTCCMLQIFSLAMAKIPQGDDLVELYGYIAVWDDLDLLLNYVVNISRDDPINVEKGSLISMAGGPRRGIYMNDDGLIEYDMRIKRGRREGDDLQVIDGATILSPWGTSKRLFTFNISGDCGSAVAITLAYLSSAVEATVEVLVSEVQSGFHMSLRCFPIGYYDEIRLFDGAIVKSCALKRSVVAVVRWSSIRLKFKLCASSSGSESHRRCTFKAKTHGHNTREIKTDFALISVKVTWSTLGDAR